MKKLILLFGLLFAQAGWLYGQYVVKSEDELETLRKLPLEKMFIQSNASLFFPGEYMYFSAFCINAMTNRLSNISRIGYLELIGENGERYIKQKFNLNEGRGQGDFFIPVSLPSGNYKLIAYTHWMRNGGISQLFQDDVVIINPYESNQGNLLKDGIALNMNNSNGTTTDLKVVNDDNSIQLQTDKKNYGKREKVTLTVRNYKGPLGYGDFSINIRRKTGIPFNSAISAKDYTNKYLSVEKVIPNKMNDTVFLPEQRGELFFGQVLGPNQNPIADETVIISIPGKDFQLKSAITDTSGSFYTYVNKPYVAPVIVAQTLETDLDKQKVILKDKPSIDPNGFSFSDFILDQGMEKAIIERSIHNQIENAYYSAKPDSIISTLTVDPFDGGTPEVIYLDEYTRFPTLRETLVEIVPNVWVKKLDNDRYSFWIREKLEKYEDEFQSDPPLVLVDGVFIPNHNNLLNFNANLIEKISILRDPLVLGDKKYLGMMVIETVEGDFLERMVSSNRDTKELQTPTGMKSYFKQSYSSLDNEEFKHIPDFRSQLFWNPAIEIREDNNAQTYEFYTSDVEGQYELILDGFTTYGKPISIREIISVN